MPPAGRKLTCWTALAAGYLLAQLALTAWAGTRAPWVSYAFNIASPLLALAACCRWAYVSAAGAVRTGWALFAVAMLFWSTGMTLSAWQDLSGQVGSDTTYFSDFAYFMYGAPLLLAMSSVTHEHPPRTLQWLDAVQVLLAAYLAYTAIFSVSPFDQRSIAPIPASLLVLTYNVENLALACCASLRLLAHRRDGGQGRFYLLLTVFLWCYAGCAATYNYLTLHGVTQAWSEVLPSLPFLLLVLLAMLPARIPAAQSGTESPQTQPPPQKLTLLIDNFSPIFFTAALLGLGFAVMRTHFYLAAASLFVALLVHALRSATLQSRYMQSELALRAAHDKLEKLSLTDGLTGIANRRCFDQTLQLEWQRAARNHEPLALLIIDIDFFKSLNDSFGHPYGDACLVQVAAALHSALPRASDLAARFGGEEFAAILPATDGDGALAVAHKMQEAIAAAAIVHAPSRGGLVTASIGLALNGAGRTPEQLLAAADQALYRAKQNGRNRVED
ncbi:diguanylate cyclase [Janthinobacterium sp.]|uniref:GGDEF domain-containing protein n=1 Tax=Janthinobacterium sp. TaxID=1871054 RepID=UPI002DB78034|nr:diguanylate cyclase [Janthinobacterium sp.]HEU4818980.1 diguanylate cyclase [Janthinobacterium sp.]